MFCRQCIKVTSSTKVLQSKRFVNVKKYVALAYLQPSRLLFTTSLPNYAEKTYGLNDVKQVPYKNTKESQSKRYSKPPILSPSEGLLEKMIAGLSSDIHQKNRVYKNDFMRVLAKVNELNFSTKKQGLLLISCCGELLPDEAPASRMLIVEQVWNTIKPHTKFEIEHFNELLRVYIANNRTLTVSSFIYQMSPHKPNITTYELMLRALGESGDVNQATEVISNMKAQGIPATGSIFNSLILCQGKSGGSFIKGWVGPCNRLRLDPRIIGIERHRNLQNIQEVLTVMKSLKLEHSIDTYTAKVRSLIWNKQNSFIVEEMDRAVKNGFQFGETHVMEIVKTLANMGFYGPIPQVLAFLPQETLKSPSISPYMQSVTTSLVFQNHPIAALEIYKCLPLPSFGPKDDQGLHGRSLVRDCVKASMPVSIIGLVTQELMSSGRNPIALQNASEAALQQAKLPLALDLFTRMQQLGMPLRPHYFWPILLHNSKTYGEKGILNTIQTMVTMDVKPDYETIMNYTLPYVSFTSPQNLMKKFTDTGLTVTSVLTPMMETLLNTGQVRAASEICELFQGKVDAEKLLKPILKGYLISSDVKSTVFALEELADKATDKNKDWVGRFLCVFMQNRRVKEDITDLMSLVQAISKTDLKISTAATDYCMSRLPEKYSQDTKDAFQKVLISVTDERLVDDADLFTQQMPHPNQMNEESLKAHLHELEAKGMNTRGVLRKLLQQYCKEGNLPAAREIADKCLREGVFLSAGMKAAIFDLHVKLGELDLAEEALADLNKSAPNFTLDEFKVIDFAALMAYRKQFDKAFNLINEQSMKRHVVGGRSIEMNCWRLLDATAAHGTVEDVRKMFEMLTTLRYCKPTNVLLGPLIRVHLNRDNLQESVQEFSRLAAKFNKTPLKHELLCKILQSMSDGQTEDNFLSNEKANGRLNKMAQTVLNIDKKVHGATDVQLTLVAALADVGYKKTLRKLFLDPTVKFHPDALLRRCERFSTEKKVAALEAIAQCVRGCRRLDESRVYELILDVHQRDDNYKEALALWTRIQEAEDVTPSQKFVNNLVSLLKANNREVPAELSMLLNKHVVVRN